MLDDLVLIGLGAKGIEILEELIKDGLKVNTVAIDDSYESIESSTANSKIILRENAILKEMQNPHDSSNFGMKVIILCDLGSHLTYVLENLAKHSKIITTIIAIIPLPESKEHYTKISDMEESLLDFATFLSFQWNL